MSQRQYERVRSYVSLLGVKLPGYKSIQNLRRRLKQKYEFDVSETVGPLGKTTFALKVKQVLAQVRCLCFFPLFFNLWLTEEIHVGTCKPIRLRQPAIHA